MTVLDASVTREEDAVRSVREIYSGTREAEAEVEAEEEEWESYGEALARFLLTVARARGGSVLDLPGPTPEEVEQEGRVPRLPETIRSREFYLNRFGRMQEFTEAHPGRMEALGLSRGQTSQILNFIDGKRSIPVIRSRVEAWTGEPLSMDRLLDYLGILEEVGWVEIG
jgi:hypothetical protein